MAHNRVISTQATAWLKKIDSQTTICKILLSLCMDRFYACQQKMSGLFFITTWHMHAMFFAIRVANGH